MLPFLVPVLFTFYVQGLLKFKCKTPVPNVKKSLLQNVTPAAVRISGASSYSYGTQLVVAEESPGSLIFNIFINKIYGSVCSSCCLVVVSIKTAVDCETFQSDSDLTYKLCLHKDMLFAVGKSNFISI
jgi:hypothetical protein